MRPSTVISVSVAWLLLAGSGTVLADPVGMPRNFMRVFGTAQPPYGFENFCRRVPRECEPSRWRKRRFVFSPERYAQLEAVNRAVNREIGPVTDLDLYKQADYWTIPATQGDCEDYVLLKRQRLIALGWPSSMLLITVVRDELGDGHAVLTARTPKGDLILDNKTDEIKIWYEVPYEFVMRQSHLNPRHWWSLDATHDGPGMALAGMRSGR